MHCLPLFLGTFSNPSCLHFLYELSRFYHLSLCSYFGNIPKSLESSFFLPPKFLVIHKLARGARIRPVLLKAWMFSFLSDPSIVLVWNTFQSMEKFACFCTLKIYYTHVYFLSLFSLVSSWEKYVSLSSCAPVTVHLLVADTFIKLIVLKQMYLRIFKAPWANLSTWLI